MEYYAGIDVSLKESSVCIVDAKGKVVREVKVASEPEALVGFSRPLHDRALGPRYPVTRLSQAIAGCGACGKRD